MDACLRIVSQDLPLRLAGRGLTRPGMISEQVQARSSRGQPFDPLRAHRALPGRPGPLKTAVSAAGATTLKNAKLGMNQNVVRVLQVTRRTEEQSLLTCAVPYSADSSARAFYCAKGLTRICSKCRGMRYRVRLEELRGRIGRGQCPAPVESESGKPPAQPRGDWKTASAAGQPDPSSGWNQIFNKDPMRFLRHRTTLDDENRQEATMPVQPRMEERADRNRRSRFGRTRSLVSCQAVSPMESLIGRPGVLVPVRRPGSGRGESGRGGIRLQLPQGQKTAIAGGAKAPHEIRGSATRRHWLPHLVMSFLRFSIRAGERSLRPRPEGGRIAPVATGSPSFHGRGVLTLAVEAALSALCCDWFSVSVADRESGSKSLSIAVV